jgi:hypothetical protein
MANIQSNVGIESGATAAEVAQYGCRFEGVCLSQTLAFHSVRLFQTDKTRLIWLAWLLTDRLPIS